MHQIYIGLGSNVEPKTNIQTALDALNDHFSNVRSSSYYRCAGVGNAAGDFINLVASANTVWGLQRVVACLKEIEGEAGRTDDRQTIDLDLLLYDDLIFDNGTICVPRRDIEQYAYVLKPLSELAPDVLHPREKMSFVEMWGAFDYRGQRIEKIDPRTLER